MKEIQLPLVKIPDWYVTYRGEFMDLPMEMFGKLYYELTAEESNVVEEESGRYIVIPTPDVVEFSVNATTMKTYLVYARDYEDDLCLAESRLFEDKEEAEAHAAKLNEERAKEAE
jgi:hypothetical protein